MTAMRLPSNFRRLRGRRGATIVFVALAMVVLLSFAALAIDVGYLYVVRNELQNAADSGALAGAQVLYNDEGTSINEGANGIAEDYVENNQTEKVGVTVESVERGHWNFLAHAGLPARTFTPNNSLDPVPLWTSQPRNSTRTSTSSMRSRS